MARFNLTVLIFSLLSNFFLGFSLAYAQLTPLTDYPAHIHQSFSLGLLYNSHIKEQWLRSYAAEVIRRTQTGKAQKDLIAQLPAMPLEAVKTWATAIFPIEYVEVAEADLKKLGHYESIENALAKSESDLSPLRFLKNGQVHVRWFIHPFRENVATLLQSLGTKKIQKGRYWAQFTESRSTIVFDTHSKGIWSIKLSIPKGTTIPFAKPLTPIEVSDHMAASRIVTELENTGKIPKQTYQREVHAVGFTIFGLSEAQMVRSLADISAHTLFIPGPALYTKGLNFFLPKGFSPIGFEYLIDMVSVFANKTGQLAAHTGLLQNSNHPQNSGALVNLKTSQIHYLCRDFDFHLDMANPNSEKYASQFKQPDTAISRGIDFRSESTFNFKGTGYDKIEHQLLKAEYMVSFQFGFFAAKGYKGPVFEVSPESNHLPSMELNERAEQKTKQVLKDEATARQKRITKALAEQNLLRYYQMISRDHQKGITDILMFEEKPISEIKLIAKAIKRVRSESDPNIWTDYFNQLIYNFENARNGQKSALPESQLKITMINFAQLAAQFYDVDQEQLLKRFILRSLKLNIPEAVGELIDKIDHHFNDAAQESQFPKDLTDVYLRLLEDIKKYSTQKQRKIIGKILPHIEHFLGQATAEKIPSLPPLDWRLRSAQMCLFLFN